MPRHMAISRQPTRRSKRVLRLATAVFVMLVGFGAVSVGTNAHAAPKPAPSPPLQSYADYSATNSAPNGVSRQFATAPREMVARKRRIAP